MLRTFKAVFTSKDVTQKLAAVEAKNLEDAITKLVVQKQPDENMNTPIEQFESTSAELKKNVRSTLECSAKKVTVAHPRPTILSLGKEQLIYLIDT